MDNVNLLSYVYGSPESEQPIIDALQSDLFCQSEDLNLDFEQIALCQIIVGQFVPPAMTAIAKWWEQDAMAICHEWYDGIC